MIDLLIVGWLTIWFSTPLAIWLWNNRRRFSRHEQPATRNQSWRQTLAEQEDWPTPPRVGMGIR